MLRSALTFVLILLLCSNTGYSGRPLAPPVQIDDTLACDLYTELALAELGLRRKPFDRAMNGLRRLAEKQLITRDDIISIADYTKSANEKRLYVIDLDHKKVLYHTYVSHGRNTGNEYARQFGNEPGSLRSSLGFYATGAIYQGAHGQSLRLLGLEPGFNDRALERGIVIHGASYVSEDFIGRHGRLGRSHGCPAVGDTLCKPLIGRIAGGTCLYIHYPDSTYLCGSSL